MAYTAKEWHELSKAKVISRTHYSRCYKCGLYFWNRVFRRHTKACKGKR